tara:strand:- start:2463 stop:2702 length:240 start_codon:yes stop_codon:yes gene_type:complete
MNIRRLIYSKFGKNIISILLGLGLATIFRKACTDRNCMIFKAPEIEKIKNKTFKYNNKCYRYKENAVSCDKNKKIVNFA